MTFNGSSGNEIFAATPIGDRLAFTRNLGNIFMDTVEVERVDLHALGGRDLLTVDDLTGTDVTELDVDLAAALGGSAGDGAIDSITVNGTAGDDAITVAGSAGSVDVTGLVPLVAITDAESADTLTVDGGEGNDTVDSTGLAPAMITLSVI